MTMITCQKCGETKEEEEFHNNKNKSNGKERRCKLCSKEYYKEACKRKKAAQGICPLCECGCGEKVRYPGNTHIVGHQLIGKTRSEEIKRKQSEAYHNKSDEEKEERSRNISEAWQNKSPEEKAETSRKMSAAIQNRTPEEKAEVSRNISEAGNNKPPVTEEASRNISEAYHNKSDEKKAEHSRNISAGLQNRTPEKKAEDNRKHSETWQQKTNEEKEEHNRKISATRQGIPYEDWVEMASESPYCPLFNDACKESNREKYGRRCFICGLPESENLTKTGKLRKLGVHHVDMDKSQGCEGKRWKLVPTCMHHHQHNDEMMYRIIYLLENNTY